MPSFADMSMEGIDKYNNVACHEIIQDCNKYSIDATLVNLFDGTLLVTCNFIVSSFASDKLKWRNKHLQAILCCKDKK